MFVYILKKLGFSNDGIYEIKIIYHVVLIFICLLILASYMWYKILI